MPPEQLNSFFFSPLPAYLLFVSMDFKNKYKSSSFFYPRGGCLGEKQEIVVWIAWLEKSLDRMCKLKLMSTMKLQSNLETHRL